MSKFAVGDRVAFVPYVSQFTDGTILNKRDTLFGATKYLVSYRVANELNDKIELHAKWVAARDLTKWPLVSNAD